VEPFGQLQSYCLDLIRLPRISPEEGRDGWLLPLLQALQRAAGAGACYLGEAGARGWVRTGLVGAGLERREERHMRGLSRRLLTAGDTILLPEIRKGSLYHARHDGWAGIVPRSYAAARVPLEGADRAWLVLLGREDGPVFDMETMGLLRLAAEAAASAAVNEERVRVLEELALTDGLTLIPNYRSLRQTVQREIARAERCEGFFTVVMVDVDNLKAYNQHHGHLAGSDVLRDLARLLRDNVRRTDLAAKYGGDEFLLVLPQTRPEGGVVLCERIRRMISEQLRGCAGEVLSCSFGVAGYPEDGRDFEGLARAADMALFWAKKEGRNAVVCLSASAKAAADSPAGGASAAGSTGSAERSGEGNGAAVSERPAEPGRGREGDLKEAA